MPRKQRYGRLSEAVNPRSDQVPKPLRLVISDRVLITSWLVPWALLITQGQVPLPGTSSVSVPLASSADCRTCHGMFDQRSAWETWAGSPMGHAARNPLFLSALTEAEKDSPGIGDFCLRCHAPEAWLQGRCRVTDGSQLRQDDAGISCAFCHRTKPSPWHRNGQYIVADNETPPIYRGPYADAMADHRNQPTTWLRDPAFCGTCHDFRNPRATWRGPGHDGRERFAEQTTYTEWNTSAFANGPMSERKTCQDCHMPKTSARVAEMGPVRPDRTSHDFSGGNSFLPSAISFLEPGLGLGPQLSAGQNRAQASLRMAASVELRDPPAMVSKGQLVRLSIRVTNLTGHKLPTGYPEGRRVWLEVSSAPLGIALGGFDQNSGEPVNPAAIYHVKQGIERQGRPSHRLALTDTIYFDSRIPPKGMTVTATTAPVGKTYPVENGVLAHYDDVTVTATIPCDLTAPSIPISAKLWYQSVTKAYVSALVQGNGSHPRGARLQAAYNDFVQNTSGRAEVAALSVMLRVDPASACGRDGGGPDSARPDTGRPDGGASPEEDSGQPAQPSEDVKAGCSCDAAQRNANDGALLISLIALGFALGIRKRSRG